MQPTLTTPSTGWSRTFRKPTVRWEFIGISYGGFTAPYGARESASGVESFGADEPDGGRLDGRRLVPQRSLPPAEHAYIYEQQATRDNSEKWWSGQFDDYDQYMRAGSAGELGSGTAWNRSVSGARFSRIPPTMSSGAIKRWTRSLQANRSSAGHAGPQSVGPGRYLWRHRRL